ncbi:hypothetical protein HELRODRAFT_138126, partial [Helobdella robusta]|uniref:PDZ domain-containing protein n=1 Tax=Helobdella robusta TaxID=6412 RepID=T1EIR9_HELRO
SGLGFSIVGGRDVPDIPNDDGIFVSRITPGSIAHLDGRIKVRDKVLSVNNIDLQGINHAQATNTLK